MGLTLWTSIAVLIVIFFIIAAFLKKLIKAGILIVLLGLLVLWYVCGSKPF